MFYSKCRGAIWVAAFCFKRLKKAQVKETDISSSVDKILQDEMNFDSYRVLAYLLLGVVRIYSKKVEYLFHDCNEVLIKIKKFTIDTENNANMKTLRMSITIPDRFELDAFDLDILEDVGGGHIAPKEEITLKDVLYKDEGIGQFSLDKYQCEFDFCQYACSADHLLLEDIEQSQLMDNEHEVSPPNNPINLQASKEKFQGQLFSQEEPVNFDTIFGVKGVPTEPINLFIQDQQINEEQTVLEAAPYEDSCLENIILCEISREEHVDVRMFTRKGEEPMGSITISHQVGEEQIGAKKTSDTECQMHLEIGEVHEARISLASMERLQDDICNKKELMDRSSIAKEKIEKLMESSVEKHHNADKLKLQETDSTEDGEFGEEQIKVQETADTECQMHQEIEEVHKARNSPVSMERLQDDISNKNECTDSGRSSFAQEKIEKLIEGSVEKHCNKGRLNLQEKVSAEDDKFHVIPSESKCLDITPQTKFPGNSVSKPKQGATMSEFMHISTPSVRERARFSRKRKCVLDGLVVLPNEVLRQSIHDASDLISKRRKVLHPLLAAWKASRISSLPEGFYESLLPCHSLELQILFSKKKFKISKSLNIVETPVKLDKSESEDVDRLEPNVPAPKTPPQLPKIRLMECQESTNTENSDNTRPSSVHECIERKKSMKKDAELLIKECDVGTSRSCASTREEQCLRKDEELDLMNEESNSLGTQNSDSCGWSGRTTKVARYLHKHFLDLRKQREGEVVNFSQVLGGRAKKECARIFYEILVLRTTSCLDVKQNNAYGDISIWRLPKLDQSFEDDGV